MKAPSSNTALFQYRPLARYARRAHPQSPRTRTAARTCHLPAHRPGNGTANTFQVKPGSLFPALHRMQEAGWLSSSWGESENTRRAKFYRLTKAGTRQLKQETDHWARISAAMASALEMF